ncbi:MAG: hypothetical protein EAZ97_03235 [Bacteroidetes bacterium]|nr:MAG: hypothetical protein EAZ97_03235 [Bacteroidota bacterium]
MKNLLKKIVLGGLFSGIILSCQENKDTPQPQNNQDTPLQTLGLSPSSSSALATVSPFAVPSFSGTMPTNFLLQMPEVGNQGREGSCVAWAVAYATRSYHMPNKPYNNGVIRSPEYVYNQIKVAGCESGSYFVNSGAYKGALNLLKDEGVCSWEDMPYTDAGCSTQPNGTQKDRAKSGKIIDFERITNFTTNNLKTILLNKFPIIIGAKLDDGFMKANSSFIWKNTIGGFVGNHAMAICGYDDSKNAFRVINSWSTTWGDAGYTWLDYNHFSNVIFEAYIVYPTNDNAPNDLNNGLVLNMPFNGNTQDISGNSNNGTNFGAVLTTDRKGNINSAYQFNGSSYIKVEDTNSLDVTQEATFSVWINQTSNQGTGRRIIDKGTAGVDNGYVLDAFAAPSNFYGQDFSCGQGKDRLRFIGGEYIMASTCYDTEKWIHFTVVFKDGVIKIYYNGVLSSTKNINRKYIPVNNLPIGIGATISDLNTSVLFFIGKIDDIRIYNRALSETEIRQLYQL